MVARIDFDMFKKEEPVALGGGVITGAVKEIMSDSKALSSVIDLVDKGSAVYWVSNGDWSMHQLLMALLAKIGAAHVSISSYAFGETPARILSQLKDEKAILSLRCVIDDRVDTRTAGSSQLIKAISDEHAMISTHAKVTLLLNDQWQVSVIGSANYTENKRFECGVITTDANVYQFNDRWITKALVDGNK